MKTHPVLGKTELCPTSRILATGYFRFESPSGIDGLAKPHGPTLEILAVHARKPGHGQFRLFIGVAQENFQTIKIWHVWNGLLKSKLLYSYGFREVKERAVFADGSSEEIEGCRWDR